MADYYLSDIKDQFSPLMGYSVDMQRQIESFEQVLNLGSKLAEISLDSIYARSSPQSATAETVGKTQIIQMGEEAKVTGTTLTVHGPWMLDLLSLHEGRESDMYRDILLQEAKAAINFADQLASAANQKEISVVFHSSNSPFNPVNPTQQNFLFDKFNRQVVPVAPVRLPISKEQFREVFPEIWEALQKNGVENKAIKQVEGGIELDPAYANIWYPIDAKRQIEMKLIELELQEKRMNEILSQINAPEIQINENGVWKIIPREKYEEEKRQIEQAIKLYEGELKSIEEGRFVSIKDVAPDLAAKNIAEMAFYSAFNTSTKPAILIENTTSPNYLLSNPEDVAKAIDKARELFVEKAVKEKGMKPAEARELAEKIIGMNLDIGHLNLLKSIKNPETGKPYSDQDLVNIAIKVKDYIKKYHLADNLGYTDTHLPLGEGNAPTKQIYEKLKELGVEAPAILEVFGKEGILTGAMLSDPYVRGLLGIPSPPEPVAMPIPYSSYIQNPIEVPVPMTPYTSPLVPELSMTGYTLPMY